MLNPTTQLGSSKELAEKLDEPFAQPSSGTLDGLQPDLLQSSEHHVFEIDPHDYVRKLWQDVKEFENVGAGREPTSATEWSVEKKNRLALFYER